jgi:hypothetical protein
MRQPTALVLLSILELSGVAKTYSVKDPVMATEPKRHEPDSKSPIFNRNQLRWKFPKTRTCRRHKLRLCSFSDLLGLHVGSIGILDGVGHDKFE